VNGLPEDVHRFLIRHIDSVEAGAIEDEVPRARVTLSEAKGT